MKIISWNVNGIRAVLKNNFFDSLKRLKGEIVCLQETKAKPEQVEHSLKDLGYKYEYWNSAKKKGYSGTAIFSKIKPKKISYGIGLKEFDEEGRVITCEFENFYLVTVYTPYSKRGLLRLDYKKRWDEEFLKYVKKLKKEKQIIFCGDLNVAHEEIDLKNPKNNHKNPGFTYEEREDFTKILNSGFIDTFRYLHPVKVEYSWWSYMFHARDRNIGWRIDYFCISENLRKKLIESKIHSEIFGSDHCPISLEIKI